MMAIPGGYVSAQKNGLAIIITNDYKETDLTPLTVTHEDGDKMELVFQNLRYEVLRWRNYTSCQLQDSLRKISSSLNIGCSSYSCIVVIFSGHGTADEDRKLAYVFTQDLNQRQKFPVQEMLNYFMPKSSPAIATIPKVFLIDACLGEKDAYQYAVTVPKGCGPAFQTEAAITEKGGRPSATIDVPPEGNFILAYSTSIGYRSYQREPYGKGQDWCGGIWLNSLSEKIQSKAHCESVMNILTDVNGDLLRLYQEGAFKQAMTQPHLIGQSHGTVYFVPQQSNGAMAVQNGTPPPAVEQESSSLNVSMMSISESPTTVQASSPLICYKTLLNNMWQAKRISEPKYKDILKPMGSVVKYLATVTFKLSLTNELLFFESSEPKVYSKEACEEAAKSACEYLNALARQTPKSSLAKQSSSPQQSHLKKQSSSDNTPVQVLKMACESARHKYSLNEVTTNDIQTYQFKVTVMDGNGTILCEEVGSPQGSKKAAKHNAASRANARLGFS